MEEDQKTHDPITRYESTFYSPLGVGVKFKDYEGFRSVCLKRTHELAESFGISQKRLIYDSESLKEELAHQKAIPFCDTLITQLRNYIELIHYTYVIMPPKDVPTVTVGGYKSPAIELKSAKFLRNLNPMFSHIAAWAYFGLPRLAESELQLDNFTSKQTNAWRELTSKAKPTVFPHGDECNPYIMISDLLAYLTDAKLYSQKLRLRPDALETIWDGYGFNVETHFLDTKTLPKYAWYSDEPIDLVPYLAHPLIFLLADDLERLQPGSPEISDDEESESSQHQTIPEEKRFRKLVRRMEPWYNVTAYAYSEGGAAQLFDYYIDRTRVKDGDTMVYVGPKSKEMAESFSHMYDVEAIPAKELRKRLEKKKIIPL